MKQNLRPLSLNLAGILCFSIVSANASTFTWSSANTSGSWSAASNWLPSTAAAPTTSDTATLGDATANRIVYYDTSASGTLGTLNFTETSGFLNQLSLYRNLNVANGITLGAASGTSAIFIDTALGSNGTSGANLTLTSTSGITINSGGRLAVNVSGLSNTNTPTISGNLALNTGGQLIMYRGYSNATAAMATLSGNFTMTGGTLSIGAAYGSYANVTNNRWAVTGNIAISGGTIVNGGGANLRVSGTSIAINNVTFSGDAPAVTLISNSNQTFTSNVAWSPGSLSAFGINSGNSTGNAIKYVGSSIAGGTLTLGWIQMGETGASGTTTLCLTSDITSIGTTQLNAQNGGGAGKVVTLGIDTNGHTLDLTANTNSTTAWTLSGASVGNSSAVIWLLNNSAGSGTTGKIKAQGFDFSAVSGSGISVGSYMTLESAGAAVANNLSAVSGTIASTSTFLYSGSSTLGSPATLTSTRNIGNLTVTKGALKITGTNLVAAGTVTVDAGGTLDLSTYNVTAGGGFVLGSGTASGYVYGGKSLILSSTSGSAVGATLISGTVASVISSGTAQSTVTKTNANTSVTLTGNNTYLGATSINAGVLAISNVATGTNAQALGAGNTVNLGVAATSSGTLQYTGAAGTLDKAINALGNGLNTVQNAGSGTLTLAGSITNNGTGLVVDGGNSGITLSGIVSGSGANSNLYFKGQTVLSGTANGSNLTVASGTTTNRGQATFTNTLSVNAGAHLINNGGLTATALTVGGVMSGTGAINGALTIQSGGELAGGGNGTMGIEGSLTVASSAKVSLQLASLSSFDSLTASGGVTLEGNLALYLSDAFLAEVSALTAPESIVLINNTSATGIATGVDTTLTYITSSGTYTVTGNSFTIGTTVYNVSYNGGDGNDLVLTVPEPSTYAMLVGGLGMLLMGRRAFRRGSR